MGVLSFPGLTVLVRLTEGLGVTAVTDGPHGVTVFA
jgi:hypothetical protein